MLCLKRSRMSYIGIAEGAAQEVSPEICELNVRSCSDTLSVYPTCSSVVDLKALPQRLELRHHLFRTKTLLFLKTSQWLDV